MERMMNLHPVMSQALRAWMPMPAAADPRDDLFMIENDAEEEETNEADDEEGICPTCSGSGEGMHEGATCRSCRGSGVYTA